MILVHFVIFLIDFVLEMVSLVPPLNPINATNVRPKGVGFGHEDAKKSGKERNKKKKFDHYAQGARQAAQDRFRQMYEEGY